MLKERLLARIPGVQPVEVAVLPHYRLSFHMRGTDRSGKCNIIVDPLKQFEVYGVVYRMGGAEDFEQLDQFEKGYNRIQVQVIGANQQPVEVTTYQAMDIHMDPSMRPYDWYRALVLAGSKQLRLPEDYIQKIRNTPAEEDPEPKRPTRVEAIELLKNSGFL